jgi:hypothetical protein
MIWGGDGSTEPREARVGEKTSLTIILSVETHSRLRGQAARAASAEGLAETDLAYGEFVASHIGAALEEAYRADTAHASFSSSRSAETFATISLSPALADHLRTWADGEARREAITAGKDHEDFVYRSIGQRLEGAYAGPRNAG